MITLRSYNKFPRGFCADRRPRVFGGHPLDSWVSKEYLAQLLTRQELALDHLNAIRLLKELVAAGAKTRAPMASAWVDKIAVRDVSLHGTGLAILALSDFGRPRPSLPRRCAQAPLRLVALKLFEE